MSDRIKKIKIKQADGTFSDYIPIGANAKDIDLQYNGSNVENTLKKKPYYYDNVATMKLDNTLREGDMAITLGYYEANDGGGAEYEIIDNSELQEDDCIVYKLNNNLKAKLVYSTIVKAEQLGFKGNDLSFDNNMVYKKIEENSIDKFTIQFGAKTYSWSPTCLTNNHFNFNGIKTPFDSNIGTQFVPFENNQHYIMKIGGYEDMHAPSDLLDVYFGGFNFTNICFSDNKADVLKPVTDYLFGIEYCAGISLDVSFRETTNTNIYFRNCWEIDVENLYMRNCTADIDKSLIYIDTVLTDNSSNTSRLFFKNIDCESFSCMLFSTGNKPNMTNILIDCISVENGKTGFNGNDISSYSDFEDATLIPLFNLYRINGLTINTLNLHRFAYKYYYEDEDETIKYIDSIFKFNAIFNVSVGQINLNDCGGFIYLASGTGGNLGQLIVNSINNPYALNYYGGTHSQSGQVLFSDIFYNVTWGSIEIIKTNSLINVNNNIVDLYPILYKNSDCFKLTPCQYTAFQTTFDEFANDIVTVRQFQSNEETYQQFTKYLKVPYDSKIYVRCRGSINKIVCHKIKDSVDTTDEVLRGDTNPNTYKDYVFDIKADSCDYIYFTAPNNNTFYVHSIEVQRAVSN